jgi:hypothetical protein
MEKIQNKFAGSKKPAQKNQYLHSPDHLLADELSQKFNDPKHFGFYLKTATQHDHAVLRRLAGEVLESKTVNNPAKLFSYLIKKRNQEIKSTQTPT